jgi:hypothetical protein
MPPFRKSYGSVKIALQWQPAGASTGGRFMAKGQAKSNKEKKKPKADTAKVKQQSAYKASQGGKK